MKNGYKRISYGQLEEVLEIPDLISVQADSYADFLQQPLRRHRPA